LFWIGSWTKERLEGYSYHRFLREVKKWRGLKEEPEPTILIFDEAQTSYWDANLWNEIFKNIRPSSFPIKHRAIIFTSYGGPNRSAKGTPGDIPLIQQVSLHRTEHHDGLKPAGLLYTLNEYEELMALMSSFNPGMILQDELKHEIFRLTGGHPGAIEGTLIAIQKSSVCNLNNIILPS
jgi:hypothetical protein